MTGPDDDPRSIGRVIRDPIHDYVLLPSELIRLVNHPYVQRLRRVSQTSMSSAVYPSMTGTRFEHCLGSMHLAQRAWDSAWRNASAHTQQMFMDELRVNLESSAALDEHTSGWLQRGYEEDFSKETHLAVAAAALLHDVGHTPFSHVLEDFYAWRIEAISPDGSEFRRYHQRESGSTAKSFHEIAGEFMAAGITAEYVERIPWRLTLSILRSQSPGGGAIDALKNLVSGEIDVDRLDYLIRDCRNSGTEFGAIDAERLIHSLELHRVVTPGEGGHWSIGYGLRARSAIETFLYQRHQYYRWVVYHPHTIAANRMLNLALVELVRLARTPTSPLGNHVAPALGYFERARNDTEVYENSSIDDSTIVSWIKAGSTKIRASVMASTMPRPGLQDMKFLALAEATLFRKANWDAVWKTEYDYTQVAEDVAGELMVSLDRICDRVDAKILALSGLTDRRSAQDYSILKAEREFLTMSRDSFAMLLNEISKHLLSASGKAVRLLREQHLSDLMKSTGSLMQVADGVLSDGFWILAYDEIVPIREGNDSVAMFAGHEQRSLVKDSPSAANLLFVEESRPRLHAYLVSPIKKLRDGPESLYLGAVRDAFLRAFPKAVEKMWTADLNI
jgi:HD superfamily phosphohydrolase